MQGPILYLWQPHLWQLEVLVHVVCTLMLKPILCTLFTALGLWGSGRFEAGISVFM